MNDFAKVLTDDDRAYLENFLRTLERDTTAEVVVVTVTSLDGMTIEEYANRLFADWGIGTKTKDNGVLLLVAPAERKVRIEVGYGLEGSLPDGLAGEIVRTAILPEFKQGNLRRGIGRGLDRISRVVRGDAAAVTRAPAAEPESSVPPVLLVVTFVGIFVVLGGVAVWYSVWRWRSGSGRVGRIIGGAPCGRARLEARQPATQAPGSWAAATAPPAAGPTSGSDSSSSSSDFGGGSSGGGGASGSW